MSNINVNIDTEKVTKETDVTALCKTDNIVIANQTDYESAADILKKIKARSKELESQRKEITIPLDTAKKSIMDLFRSPLELLEKAESSIKRLMINYTDEQERKAREEQRKLQELADKEAARQKKLIDEQIARAEASGKTDKVEALQEKKETIIPVVAPVIAPVIETPKGVSFREKWTAKVIDKNLVPREYLIVNQSALDKVAQATKGSIKIAGVEFISEKILASR
jgi:uncharacterized protein YdiU (UPF0061 family)